MGTDYTVHEAAGTKVEISEMSNRFSVFLEGVMVNDEEAAKMRPLPMGAGHVFSTAKLTTEELLLMGAKIMQTALYWGPDEASRKAAAKVILDGDPCMRGEFAR